MTTYTYDAANRLINAGGVAHIWDANGNLLNDGSRVYAYDSANRLISTTLSGVNTQFGYNGDGIRLRLIEAGTLTTYTQDYAAPLPVVLQAKTESAATQYVYSLGTRPLAEYETAAWEYLLADPLGSMRQLADSSGNVALLKSYEPYGSVLNSQGTATSVFAYAGEQIDGTGLIYLRARYMQPRLGIFLSRDQWPGDQLRPGSMNGWNYVNNNPILYVDPSGNITQECHDLGWTSPVFTLYCDLYVWGDRDSLRQFMQIFAVAMGTVGGLRQGASQLRHYLNGDGSDRILSSRWYLGAPRSQTDSAASDLRRTLIVKHMIPFMTICNQPYIGAKRESVEVDPGDLDIKASLGVHIIHGVLHNWDETIGDECDCQGLYRIDYEINDLFDFDPVNTRTNQPQFVPPIPQFGIGAIPFAWLKDLADNGKAYEFQTRIRWTDEIFMRTTYGKVNSLAISRIHGH